MTQETEPIINQTFGLANIPTVQETPLESRPIVHPALEIPIDFDLNRRWSDKYKLSESQLKEFLAKAENHVFSMGVQDTASHIGELVSKFFVAKMFYVQNKLGLPLHASVIQPPDATIQTFHLKFARCVPEAAKVSWSHETLGEAVFIPAEVDIDFCGMVAVGVEDEISGPQLAENILAMKKKLKHLDGLVVDTNCIQPGNHFANIYRVLDNERFNLPHFIGVAHLASDEYRDFLRDFVERQALKIETPFGDCLALIGESAEKYLEITREGSRFALKKRALIAQDIFRSDNFLANDAHYEITSPTSCIIGCNLIKEDGEPHVIVTKAGGEAYLVKGKRNLSNSVLQNCNIETDSPIYEELLQANILPHGSGHRFVEDTEFKEVKFTEDGILYVTRLPNGTERVVSHYSGVPTTSRGSILPQVLKHDLVNGDYVTLKPLCSVKV